MAEQVEIEYKELVELVSEKSLDFDFPNTSVEHAKYVIGKIIETSKDSVKIFTNDLNHPIFDNPEIIGFIKKNQKIKVKILLEDTGKQKNPKIEELTNVEIKKGIKELKDWNYFIMGDKTKLRICSRDTPHKAIVNFNDKKRGDKWDDKFEEVWAG